MKDVKTSCRGFILYIATAVRGPMYTGDVRVLYPSDMFPRPSMAVTGVGALDRFLESSISTGCIIQLYGEAGVGKSQLLFTLLAHSVSETRRILFFDTQGKFRPERLAEIASKKGLSDPLPFVDVVQSQDPRKLLEISSKAMHGSFYHALIYDDIAEPFLRYGYRSREAALLSTLMRYLSVWSLVRGRLVFVTQRVSFDPVAQGNYPLGEELTMPYISYSFELKKVKGYYTLKEDNWGDVIRFEIYQGGVRGI